MYFSNDPLDVELLARHRYGSGRSDSLYRRNRYEELHRWYAPIGGDQWPEDIFDRPGKMHITSNIVRRFCDTEARLLSKPPRITVRAQVDPIMARKAEATEKLFNRFLDQSGFRNWFFTLEQTKTVYGIGVLKPFWNADTKAPDVVVVEQPQNIMFGWGDSEFIGLDWTIYHYRISKLQAKLRYKECPDEYFETSPDNLALGTGKADHGDPLAQIPVLVSGRNETEYEMQQVEVWDYWYLDPDGKVMSAILINGHIVEGPTAHSEYPAIPYILIEHDHEMGSPDGRGTAELLIDIQDGLNRAVSHYAQYVWDNSDPAYQLTGEDAPMTVPDGLVPRAGELVAPGARTRIELINTGVNNFPFDALINAYMALAHKVTGLSEILFGQPAAGGDTGRALAVQLESSINALEPKRNRSYTGLQTLLMMWHYMMMSKNPEVTGAVTMPEGIEMPALHAKDIIEGLNDWVIIAPEITPRDVREHTMNTIDKVNMKLLSTQSAMDEIGVENPLEELDRIRDERSDARLYPGDAQAIAAVMATLQAIEQQQAGQAQAAAAQGEAAQNKMMNDQQMGQPSLTEDMNQVATGPGMAPPAQGGESVGGDMIGGEMRPIVRQSGDESMPMSELRLPVREF